jgi:hypothetical protein
VAAAGALLRALPGAPGAAACLLAAALLVPLVGAPALYMAQAWRVDVRGAWDVAGT